MNKDYKKVGVGYAIPDGGAHPFLDDKPSAEVYTSNLVWSLESDSWWTTENREEEDEEDDDDIRPRRRVWKA